MSLATTVLIGVLSLMLGMAIRIGWNRFVIAIYRSGRLVGLTALAIYQLSAGFLYFVLTGLAAFPAITRYVELRAKLAQFGTSPIELVTDLFITSFLATISGIGLWLRTRWSWNVAVYVMGLSFARNLLSM